MEKALVKLNRAQALAFFNLSQRMPVAAELEITSADNYGALVVECDGNRYNLPRTGGVVPLPAAPLVAATA